MAKYLIYGKAFGEVVEIEGRIESYEAIRENFAGRTKCDPADVCIERLWDHQYIGDVPYLEYLISINGCAFVLVAFDGISDSAVKSAKAKLLADRDVVSLSILRLKSAPSH